MAGYTTSWDSVTRDDAYRLLQACEKSKDLKSGRQVQLLMAYSGLSMVSVLGDHLIRLFSSHGNLVEANQAFQKIAEPTVHTWAAIISANSKLGQGQAMLELYPTLQSGIRDDRYVYIALLKACAMTRSISHGRIIDDLIKINDLSFDVVLKNTLLDMYAKSGSIEEACKVFYEMSSRNVVSWNAIIAAYAQHGEIILALECFGKMQQDGIKADVASWSAVVAGCIQCDRGVQAVDIFTSMDQEGVMPNEMTFSSALKACCNIQALNHGRLFHEQIIENEVYCDSVLGSSLIDMYAKCGSLVEADKILHKVSKPNVELWNSMISGYAQQGESLRALELFDKMQTSGIRPDVISWNALIAGYIQEGKCLLALDCFAEMQEKGMKPDEVTLSSMLKACSGRVAVEQGRFFHEHIINCGLRLDVVVGNTLVDMYVKCGSLEEACLVFNQLHHQDAISWGSMVTGFAKQGDSYTALELFEKMQRTGIKPDEVLFTNILTACSRGGFLDEGRWYFKSMTEFNGIIPTVSHYVCMVDLLGRVGHTHEAEDLVCATTAMNVVGWISLLNSCRMHKNLKGGKDCFDHSISLDFQSAAGYVLMSNICADTASG